jgi:precorrin-6B methylase 2
MLTPTEQDFIAAHQDADPAALVLQAHRFVGLDVKKLANQILIRKKAMHKLPTWAAARGVFFPSSLAWQQCSSEQTARYKASLLQGATLADLTGGFGVDVFYLAAHFDTVFYVEQDPMLCEIAAYNYGVLQQPNIVVTQADSVEELERLPDDLTAIYIDPARRDERAQRVVGFEDCTPNVLQLQAKLLAKAKKVLIKAAPMLDIRQALRQLEKVEAVHVVAVDNECKELLFVLNREQPTAQPPTLTCVNLQKDGAPMLFESGEIRTGTAFHATTSVPQRYLYDPNKALHKARLYAEVGQRFGVLPLAATTHLFTSDSLNPDFQGRIFELKGVLKPTFKAIKAALPSLKANIIVRNFPEKAEVLKQKFKIKDGGAEYLIAVTLQDGQKCVLWCVRVKV